MYVFYFQIFSPKLLLQKSILPSMDTITHVKADLESDVAKWLWNWAIYS